MGQATVMTETSRRCGLRSTPAAGSFGSRSTTSRRCSMVLRTHPMPESASKSAWTRVTFGDLVRQVRDRVDPEDTDLERYVAGEHMDTDDLRIRRWGFIGDGYLGPAFHMRFKPGHVLYGSRRTYLRKVAVADFEGVTANTTFVVESKDPQVLLPELLPFIMQTESFHEHSIKQSKGSVNPYVNFSDLTRYEFALPPLEEQRRIANAMRTAQAARECVLRLANEHSRVLESLYQHEFGSRREHIEAPGGTPLGGLSTIRRGASPRPISDPRWFSASGPGWVRIRDLAKNSRYLRITEQKLSALGAERSVPVYPGEVILSIAATIGRPAI